MSNVKKAIDTQKAINEAVEAIFEYFKTDISYAEILETMAEAQMEIMHLVELNRIVSEHQSLDLETTPITNINSFLYECSCQLKLLRPFAKLMGQVYGNEE